MDSPLPLPSLLDFGSPLPWPLPSLDSRSPLLVLLNLDSPLPFLVLLALDSPCPPSVLLELDSALHEIMDGQFETHSSTLLHKSIRAQSDHTCPHGR